MKANKQNALQRMLQPFFASRHERAKLKWAALVREALTTADLWEILEQRVPRIANEYFRGGADDEITLVENVLAFLQARTTSFGARKFDSIDLSTRVAGHDLRIPWIVSPVGSLRTLWPMADAVVAEVAGTYGTVMCQSTLSGTPMEDVTNASSGDCWFQLYLCGGRDAALRGIARAKKAGFSALVLTIDTGMAGNRHKHARMKPTEAIKSFEGLSFAERTQLLHTKLKLGPQMLPRLSWLFSHLYDGGMFDFVNVQLDEAGTPMPYTDIGQQLAASAVTWEDIPWIKEAWGDKPLIIKGVHCAEDAKKAEDVGASVVIWSNHGGRQQDRVPPVLHIVASEMPKMNGSKLEFMMDGGVRRGADIMIALSYGLKAVGMGRVVAAGVGSAGRDGVDRAFEIIQSELVRAMTITGMQSVAAIHECGEKLRRDNLIQGVAHLAPLVTF